MPGAGKQSQQVQNQIKELLEAGFDPTTIHRRLKVGRSSIYRMKRCLQQHGTNYLPTELNKKNGRPKVLSAAQELEVRNWLKDPQNRNKYLDDLVWLIHERFKVVCSTTTMSKLKRKWMRVIEFEERGTPLDDATRAALLQTHPDLDLLQPSHQHGIIPPPANMQQQEQQPEQPQENEHEQQEHEPQQMPGADLPPLPYPAAPARVPSPQIDSRLDEQLQEQLASTAAAAAAVDERQIGV